MNIYGYEILYRSSDQSTSYDAHDPNSASSQVIMNSFYEMGIARVVSGKRAFINFTEKLLLDGVATILPREILAIELLSSVFPSRKVMDACRELRNKGYIIALDDFRMKPEAMPLLDIADIVKINFIECPRGEISDIVRAVSGKKIKLLAEKVENDEEYEYARKLGFSYFQGYTFSKPVLLKSETLLSPLKANCLHLIRLVFEPDAQFKKIAQVIKQDVALSYRLLRVVNSAYFGLRYFVSNIRQALAILGMNEVKKWCTLISLSEISDGKPNELIVTSLVRAMHLELIAPFAGLPRRAEDLFMAGLMSLMDVITGMSFDEVFELTKLSHELTDAIEFKTGPYGKLLQMIICYEKSQWNEALAIAETFEVSSENLVSTYLKAIEWTDLLLAKAQ